MNEKRERWDKARRQRKTWDVRDTPHGPATLGPLFNKHLSPYIKLWIRENGIDEAKLLTAIVPRGQRLDSLAAKFWALNGKLHQDADACKKLGLAFSTWSPPPEFRKWLLTFRRVDNPSS